VSKRLSSAGNDDAEQVLERLADRLHAGDRLRVWSIIITVFGDAVVPRGGTVALTALQAITARLRIEPGAVRAAMSRLVRDGWITRRKVGRRSFYQLTPESLEEVVAASRRIYAPEAASEAARVTLAVIENGANERRDRQHEALMRVGFARVDGGTYVRAWGKDAVPPDLSTADALILDTAVPGVPMWLRDTLSPPDTARAYEALIDAYTPLDEALAAGAALSPLDAMAARTLLIHDWRRTLLRDHDLPAGFRAENWPGARARRLVRELYERLWPLSERWLDGCDGGGDGPLPPASASARTRFGA